MVVWRRRLDNEWLYRAQTIVEQIVERPQEYDEPTCGPGPFSMADADTVSDILQQAGFVEVGLHRCDLPITIGRDLDEAIELVKALGPAGEILRLAEIALLICTGRWTKRCAPGSQSSPKTVSFRLARPRGSSPRG